MQNGKRILEIIQNIQALDSDWENVFLNEETEKTEVMEEQENRLLNVLRQELKNNSEKKVRSYLQEEGLQDETIDKLMQKARWMLQFYFSFELLRNLEESDEMSLKGMLTTIYQKTIVRFEYDALSSMIDRGCDDEELMEVAERINFLTDYYVSRSLTKREIIQDLQDETGLSAENCEYWADLIEENYQALKMNFIIKKLDRIQEEISKLKDE